MPHVRGIDPSAPEDGAVYQIRRKDLGGLRYTGLYDDGDFIWVRWTREHPWDSFHVFTTLQDTKERKHLGPGGGWNYEGGRSDIALHISDLEVIDPDLWKEWFGEDGINLRKENGAPVSDIHSKLALIQGCYYRGDQIEVKLLGNKPIEPGTLVRRWRVGPGLKGGHEVTTCERYDVFTVEEVDNDLGLVALTTARGNPTSDNLRLFQGETIDLTKGDEFYTHALSHDVMAAIHAACPLLPTGFRVVRREDLVKDEPFLRVVMCDGKTVRAVETRVFYFFGFVEEGGHEFAVFNIDRGFKFVGDRALKIRTDRLFQSHLDPLLLRGDVQEIILTTNTSYQAGDEMDAVELFYRAIPSLAIEGCKVRVPRVSDLTTGTVLHVFREGPSFDRERFTKQYVVEGLRRSDEQTWVKCRNPFSGQKKDLALDEITNPTVTLDSQCSAWITLIATSHQIDLVDLAQERYPEFMKGKHIATMSDVQLIGTGFKLVLQLDDPSKDQTWQFTLLDPHRTPLRANFFRDGEIVEGDIRGEDFHRTFDCHPGNPLRPDWAVLVLVQDNAPEGALSLAQEGASQASA